MAPGGTDLVLVVGAVNVNVAVVRVRVPRLDAIEPQNARHNQIVFTQHLLRRFHRFAALENRSGRHPAADLFCDPELSGRRFEAAFFRAQAELGSGNRIRRDRFPPVFQGQTLIAHRDLDFELLTFFHSKRQ